MSFFAFLVVLVLLVVVAFLFFIIGFGCATVDAINKLKEKGWTIEPPKENIYGNT